MPVGLGQAEKVIGAALKAWSKAGLKKGKTYITAPTHTIARQKARSLNYDTFPGFGSDRLFITDKGRIVSKEKATKLMEKADQEIYNKEFGATGEDLVVEGASTESALSLARAKANALGVYGKVLGLGSAAVGLEHLRSKEAEAMPLRTGYEATWSIISKFLKGAVKEIRKPGQSARWGVKKLPDGRLLRIKPGIGADIVKRTPSGSYRRVENLLTPKQLMKMLTPTKVVEKDIEAGARSVMRKAPVVPVEDLDKVIWSYRPTKWNRTEWYGVGPYTDDLKKEYTSKVKEHLLAKKYKKITSPSGKELYASKRTIRSLSQMTPDVARRSVLNTLERQELLEGGLSRYYGEGWEGFSPHEFISSMQRETNMPGLAIWEGREFIEDWIKPHVDELLRSGRMSTTPHPHGGGHVLYTSERIQEAGRLAREEAKKGALDLYMEAGLSAEPSRDELLRLGNLAEKQGGLKGKEVKRLAPSFAQRNQELMGKLFTGGEKVSARTFRDTALKVPLTGKYRYTVKGGGPAYGMGEYTTTGADRMFFRMHVHPETKAEIEKTFPNIFRMAHGEPYTSMKVPTMGWFKVIDDPISDTWFIEEIQSDILAKARNTFFKEGKVSQEQVLAFEKKFGDWAAHGLATILEKAREDGIGSVKVISAKAVQQLWSGKLGEAKAETFYKKLPKRFGFDMDVTYEPQVERKRGWISGAFKVGSRIPVITFTALGAGASLAKPEEAEAISFKTLIKFLRKSGHEGIEKYAKRVPKDHLKGVGHVYVDKEAVSPAAGMLWNPINPYPDVSHVENYWEWFGSKEAIKAKESLLRKGKQGIVVQKAFSPLDKKVHKVVPFHEIAHTVYTRLPNKWEKHFDLLGEKRGVHGSELFSEAYDAFVRQDYKKAKHLMGESYPVLKEIFANKDFLMSTPRTSPYPAQSVLPGGTVLSSASKDLAGKLFRNKTIKKVLKGKGKWRDIIFSDGTSEVVDKDMVSYLARHKGTVDKMTEFAGKGRSGQEMQAIKSLEMRLQKTPSRTSKELTLAYRRHMDKSLAAKGEFTSKHVMINYRGKTLMIPEKYADILEDMGLVKVSNEPGFPRSRK